MRKINRMRRDTARDETLQELFTELSDARVALLEAYERFNQTVEPELVDACCYEISAMESRYGYLLRAIKERGGEAACRTLSEGVATWV